MGKRRGKFCRCFVLTFPLWCFLSRNEKLLVLKVLLGPSFTFPFSPSFLMSPPVALSPDPSPELPLESRPEELEEQSRGTGTAGWITKKFTERTGDHRKECGKGKWEKGWMCINQEGALGRWYHPSLVSLQGSIFFFSGFLDTENDNQARLTINLGNN